MQVYLQSLEQYSAFLMSHITKAEIADSEKYHNERQHFCLHEKLDQAAADHYRNSYGILIGQKPEVSYGYTQIAPEHLKEVLTVNIREKRLLWPLTEKRYYMAQQLWKRHKSRYCRQ